MFKGAQGYYGRYRGYFWIVMRYVIIAVSVVAVNMIRALEKDRLIFFLLCYESPLFLILPLMKNVTVYVKVTIPYTFLSSNLDYYPLKNAFIIFIYKFH